MKNMKSYGYPFLLLAFLFISACSPQATRPTLLPLQTNAVIPDVWNITAKLGIRNGDDSGSVTLYWQQQQNQYQIRIAGPLGQGNGLLSGDEENIVIERPNKQTLYSNNPAQLIKDTFGWDLPIQDLNYWVRGLASPLLDAAEQDYSASGVLSELNQSDWSLRYTRYRTTDLWLMPQRIRAEKGELMLTLVIKTWEFPNK
ncbi:MAG: outer membrane lipoprotein LolB [Kiritimatiellia bacterium]|jgi:outer membrane lipoprotein LolB